MGSDNHAFPRFLITIAIPLMALIAVCTLNYFLFRFFRVGSGYFRWYVNAGPFIGLATAAFGASWGKLDNQTGLISANPLDYVGACLQLVGLPVRVFGGHCLKKNRLQPRSILDVLFLLPLLLAFLIAAFGWLLLIAPLQYFVFLVCGAPARIALTSNYRAYAMMRNGKLEYEEATAAEPPPVFGWDASMVDKPVTLTNAFSAAVLFLIGQFWR